MYQNIAQLVARGVPVVHSVDARDLQRTLLARYIPGGFTKVVFPFPRGSLNRGVDARNTDLLQRFFVSATNDLILKKFGQVHLIMIISEKGTDQFSAWGVQDLAEQNGMYFCGSSIFDPNSLPPYQPRDLCGRPWNPYLAKLYIFKRRSEL